MKRILAVLGSLLVAAFLLELLLQGLALVMWLENRRDDKDGPEIPGTKTILCLGDSYTFGMGASLPQKSYPAQLEKKLHEMLSRDWGVVNGGWPSRNSRELLEGLDAALAAHNPKFVCVVVGLNDSWSRPEALELPLLDDGLPPAAGEFRWRLRTLRLIKILGAPIGGNEAEALENPDAHLAVLRGSLAEGDHEGASRELDWLIKAHRDGPTRWVAEALAEGLQASGREGEALEFAAGQLDPHPDSSRLWLTVAVLSARSGNRETARRSIDTALEVASTDKGARAFLWRTRANIYGDTDHTVVADSLIRAFIDDNDEVSARQWFQIHRLRLGEALMRGRCRELGLSESLTARILAVYDEAVSEDKNLAVLETLAGHLRQVVQRCRARGAEPLLGSYPWEGAFGAVRVRGLADELGVTWVPVHEHFSSCLKADPKASLFVHDGHCNDAGYGLMAEAFAAAIEGRLAAQATMSDGSGAATGSVAVAGS